MSKPHRKIILKKLNLKPKKKIPKPSRGGNCELGRGGPRKKLFQASDERTRKRPNPSPPQNHHHHHFQPRIQHVAEWVPALEGGIPKILKLGQPPPPHMRPCCWVAHSFIPLFPSSLSSPPLFSTEQLQSFLLWPPNTSSSPPKIKLRAGEPGREVCGCTPSTRSLAAALPVLSWVGKLLPHPLFSCH